MKIKACVLALLFGLSLALLSWASENQPHKPSQNDKCPVCGMFVAKYPDWVAEIIFKDGSLVFFDGAKDMFKYYFDLASYNPQKSPEDIDIIYVTEYYDTKPIDARQAIFVVGSDVYGPMGKELIPFVTEDDAQTFLKDHLGKQILRFENVDPLLLKALN